jgi:hypothetical protein
MHQQTRLPAGGGEIVAFLNAGDALANDDQLTIEAGAFEPLATTVSADCGWALRTALTAHPGLSIVEGAAASDLEVTCPRGSFPDAGLVNDIGRIRALIAETRPLATAPVWSPFKTLDTHLRLPAEYIAVSPWPVPVIAPGQRVLLHSVGEPLAAVTPSADGQTATVDTVIDLGHNEFVRQPEYAALVAILVDAAAGRQLLDATAVLSHEIAESVIQPMAIESTSTSRPDRNYLAEQSLAQLFLLAAVLVLLLDTALLVFARRRAAHA